jgi:NADH-quinone oxidoreductase subunit L
MQPETLALITLFSPLAACTVNGLFLRRRGAMAASLSVLAAGVSLVTGLHLILTADPFTVAANWLDLGSFSLDLGLLYNPLSALMLLVVVLIGFVIHVFSLGYMSEDPDRGRFFAEMSLFMFSMIGVVLADNLVLLFIFWELVGLSSYLLISFYLDRPSAVAAGNKAFIVNRVGDFGFLLGIIWAYWAYGTVNIEELASLIAADGIMLKTGIGLLIFCGAVGKSGQIPLHVWLPDAMEGPTPVSALIHAATMVAAGIYLLCRIGVIMTGDALNVIVWIGAATALYAGFCALPQKDIKKILAYSTVSQLGYMVAAFGLGSKLALLGGDAHAAHGAVNGGVAAAMFHLTTHAFFKALLFLGAGSIIHACHHEQNIFNMGGLARKMPVTFITFSIGFLALIGLPGLAGFWSKEAILALAYENGGAIFWVLAAGALLTAAYMTRLWAIAFFGPPKTGKAEQAMETGMVMTLPLIALAIGAAIGGARSLYPKAFSPILDAVPHPEQGGAVILAISGAALVIGALTAFLFYKPGAHQDNLQRSAPGLYRLLAARLWFDEIYGWYVAKVQQRFAQLLSFLEQVFISGLMVRGVAGITGLVGLGARALHTGSIHSYVFWFFFGLVALWLLSVGL